MPLGHSSSSYASLSHFFMKLAFAAPASGPDCRIETIFESWCRVGLWPNGRRFRRSPETRTVDGHASTDLATLTIEGLVIGP
jgi:hypothetical protein